LLDKLCPLFTPFVEAHKRDLEERERVAWVTAYHYSKQHVLLTRGLLSSHCAWHLDHVK
jgi:hypothetical protein